MSNETSPPAYPLLHICLAGSTFQLVVTSLLRAGWTLGRIVCIFMVWLTIFAIMGVLLWSGGYMVTPFFFEPSPRMSNAHPARAYTM